MCQLLSVSAVCELITELNLPAGKRRYDRKQSGYGGQTKPIFRKKVSYPLSILLTAMDGRRLFLNYASYFRLRLQRKLYWGWSVWRPTAGPRECWPLRDASTSSWEVTRRERLVVSLLPVYFCLCCVAWWQFSVAVLNTVIWCLGSKIFLQKYITFLFLFFFVFFSKV